MKAALALGIHDRYSAADAAHNRGQGDQQGDLHCGLVTAGPPEPIGRRIIMAEMNL
jgi:hypothetical protein